MIYQPINAYPNNTTVDVKNTDKKHPLYFEWQFHGNYMTRCSIFIYDINDMDAGAIELPYTFDKDNIVYGDDMVKILWDSDIAKANKRGEKTLKNGTEYLWKVVQYKDEPTMFVKAGKVQKTRSNTEVILQNDMHLWFNNNTECYLVINNQKQRIKAICKVDGGITQDVERTDTEMKIVLEKPFTFIPQEGQAYSVYTAGAATINGFYFRARTTPSVAVRFANEKQDLDGSGRLQYRLADFQGFYEQQEGVPIKYHYWQLYRVVGKKKELIQQTDNTYNSRLEYHFDGFVANETYELYLNVVTQEGQDAGDDDGLTFEVYYDRPIMGDDIVTISWNADHNAARLDVQDIEVSRPTLSNPCRYEFLGTDRGILHVMEGTIDYTKISNEDIDLNNFTLFSKFYMSAEKVGPIISLLFDPINDILRDAYYISVDAETDEQSKPTGIKDFMLHLIKDGYDIVKHKYFCTKQGTKPCFQDTRTPDDFDLYEYVWPETPIFLDTFNTDAQFFIMNDSGNLGDTFKLAMTPKKVYLYAVGAKKDYPIIDVDIGNAAYHCLRLYADVFYDYNILVEGQVKEEDIIKWLHDDDFVPKYKSFPNTKIFTPFTNGSLLSTNLEGVAEDLDGYLVYREKVGEGIKHRVGVLDLGTKYIEDFMVTNDNIYRWELIPISTQEYGVSIITKDLMVRFDEWTIATYEPSPDQKDVYYVDKGSVWKFGLNAEGQDLTQNILKNKLESIAQYPRFTMQKRNYITGGLTAYLANMSNNDIYNQQAIVDRFPAYSPYRINSDIYWEPAEKLIEWNKLVASGKEVIIRDIKGHMWRAQIDSNSAMIEVFAQTSPTTIEFTFTEVGSVDNCAVYLKE